MLRKNKIILNELRKWYKEDKIDKKTFDNLYDNYSKNQNDVDSIMRWSVIIGAILILIGIIYFTMYIVSSIYTKLGSLTLITISGFYFSINFLNQNKKYYYPKLGISTLILSTIVLLIDSYYILLKFNITKNEILFIIILFWSIVYLIVSYIRYRQILLILANILILPLILSAGNANTKISIINCPKITFLLVILAGIVLFIVAYAHNFIKFRLSYTYKKIYSFFGIIYVNIGLMLITLFNDYGEVILKVKTIEREKSIMIIIWVFVSILLYILGRKYKNNTFKIYATIFLFLNVYIRYFELFWNKMNKGLFFLIIGILSTAIGIYFETQYRKRLR